MSSTLPTNLSSNTSRTKPLELGVIGGGLSSEVGTVHFNAARLDGHWQISAGAFSRDSDINQQSAEAWGVQSERCYSSWQAMIEIEKAHLDAVLVLLPSPQHCEVVTQLLAAEIAVICEKPLACSSQEIEQLQTALNEHPGFLAVTYNYSGYPMLRALKTMIEAGELGEIQQLQFEMPQEGFVRPPAIKPFNAGKQAKQLPQAWRLNDGDIPMINLDLGLHLYHLAYFLTAMTPSEVMADYANFSAHEGVVDDVKIWAKYQGPQRASFWFSKTAIGHRNGMRLRLYGNRGSAEWVQTNPEELKLSELNGKTTLYDRSSVPNTQTMQHYQRMKPGHPAGFIEAFANLYCDIAEALNEHKKKRVEQNAIEPSPSAKDPLVKKLITKNDAKQPFVFGLDHTAQCIEFFSAATRSHRQQTWVSVSSGLSSNPTAKPDLKS